MHRISSIPGLTLALNEIQDLVLTENPPLPQTSSSAAQPGKSKKALVRSSTDLYNRAKYYQYAADRKAAFANLYGFCFTLAKPEQSRNLDMDVGSELG